VKYQSRRDILLINDFKCFLNMLGTKKSEGQM